MIIYHRHRFIFFSNPKTGSESLRDLLKRYNEEEIRPFAEHGDERRFYPHMTPVEARTAFALRGCRGGVVDRPRHNPSSGFSGRLHPVEPGPPARGWGRTPRGRG